MGWIGIMRDLETYLRVVGADKDEGGRFLIGKAGVFSYMGEKGENAEIVVPDEAVYYVDGEPKKLAAGLGTTSYGTTVKVIA